MADRWMERKFAELDTIPLFAAPSTRAKPSKAKPVKNAGRAKCPDCGKEVGLYVLAVRGGYRRVLAYRRHWRRRYSGTAFVCPRSNTEAAGHA